MPVVVDAVPERWFDAIAVVDLEGGYLHAALLVDHAFPVELLNLHRDAFGWELFILHANLDIEGVRLFQIIHQYFRPSRADDMESRFALSEGRRQPAGQPQVWDTGRVIRMVVGEEEDIDLSRRYFHLPKTNGSAAAGIDQNLLIARFDESTWPETIEPRDRRTCADQCHFEIAVGEGFGGSKHAEPPARSSDGKQ